ncbi:hypothetical protein PSN_3882 [Pseudomonas sp. NGC7]
MAQALRCYGTAGKSVKTRSVCEVRVRLEMHVTAGKLHFPWC